MTGYQAKLPPSWVSASLGELVLLNPRWLDSEPAESEVVSFVPMAAVEAESGRLDATNKRKWGEVSKGYTRFQEGDVVFAKITPCMENGKFALASGLIGGRAVGSTEFHVLRSVSGLEPKFVLYFLFQDSLRREARLKMKGAAGQLRVPPEFLEDLSFPLPPVNEQRRIVAEIERQFTRLEAGVGALKRVQADLKRYRAAVLKAAVEGRLVATEAELARREGRPYEPANQLLQRILAERRARWEADQLAKFRVLGKLPKDDKWKEKYKEAEVPDATNLPSLPEGWAWATASQVGEVQLGRQRSPKKRSKDYPTKYIRAANITEQGIDLNDVLDMEFDPEERKRYLLHRGDIVLSEASGSPMQVGKPAIWRDDLPGCCFQNTVIRLRPYVPVSEYLLTAFKGFYWNGMFARIAGGVGINHLGADKFSSVLVPLPPWSEQLRIVADVDRRLSVIEELETQIKADLKRADRLRQAILKRAFEGRLVPQDPDDEPASVLLERIRAERAQRENSKPRIGPSGKPRKKKEVASA